MFGHKWGKIFTFFIVYLTPIQTTISLTSATPVIYNSHGLCKIKKQIPLKILVFILHNSRDMSAIWKCLHAHQTCAFYWRLEMEDWVPVFLKSFNNSIHNQHPACVTSDFSTSQMSNTFGEVREVPVVSNFMFKMCCSCFWAIENEHP